MWSCKYEIVIRTAPRIKKQTPPKVCISGDMAFKPLICSPINGRMNAPTPNRIIVPPNLRNCSGAIVAVFDFLDRRFREVD